MVASEPTVSGVVLLVPQHLSFFFEDLVPNLAKMTVPFDELLVVCSGLSRRAIRLVEKSLDRLSAHPKRRIVRVPLGPVGANRNHGLDHSTSDLVTFLDSDDIYSPEYCAFLKEAHKRAPYQVLLHSCVVIEKNEKATPVLDSLDAGFDSPPYTNEDFLSDPLTNWKVDPKQLDSTSLRLSEVPDDQYIHQGHMTVSTEIPLRFHEDPLARNEDGVFLQQCLAMGYRLHFYPARLSAYRLGSSANPLRYRILRRMRSWS